jgi:ribonuclease R
VTVERSRIYTDFKELLKQYGLSQEFSYAVKRELDEIPDEIPEEELRRRKDLSNLTIVTIDGEDAKDLDDAVSIEKTKEGNYRLGVHIADVSYYVKENSEIDREAYNRGTSVYLVDKVVPMLPKKLSNKLCSLNPQKKRLTISCFMDINKDGTVINYEIAETFIVSSERMTYTKVTEILDGDMAARSEYKSLVPVFELMRELALILRDKRMRRGSIDFDFPEPKVITNETGETTGIEIYENTISNKIIEEFMLAANETVAKHMHRLELPSVYRVHEEPSVEKIEQFATLVRNMNYKFKVGSQIKPKSMQNLLFKIKGSPEQLMLSTMMLRSLMKARYSEENLGHFGLAADYYCHFTSPIRRYPDLMVHRIIREWLSNRLDDERIAYYSRVTEDAARQSSETEVQAIEAEREWVSYKMCEYMEDKLGQVFDALISSVTSFGLFVQLPNMVEGLIRMTDLDDDYYEYDEKTMSLTGRHTGRKYCIGQHVQVMLVKVTKDLRQIDFVPYETGKTQKEVKKRNGGKQKNKHTGKRKGRRSKQKSKA